MKCFYNKLAVLGVTIFLFLSGSILFLGCKTSSETKPVTYTSDIAPVLTQKCVGCHNPSGTVKRRPLDNYDNVKTLVTPGNASDSILIKSVDGGSMSGRLSGDEVELFKSWVNQGAKK